MNINSPFFNFTCQSINSFQLLLLRILWTEQLWELTGPRGPKVMDTTGVTSHYGSAKFLLRVNIMPRAKIMRHIITSNSSVFSIPWLFSASVPRYSSKEQTEHAIPPPGNFPNFVWATSESCPASRSFCHLSSTAEVCINTELNSHSLLCDQQNHMFPLMIMKNEWWR